MYVKSVETDLEITVILIDILKYVKLRVQINSEQNLKYGNVKGILL